MVPLSSRRTWIAAAAVLAAVLVAAIVMWPRDPALPVYEERLFEGGMADVRSDASREAVFLPSTRIRWSFAPHEEVSEPVALRILAEGPTRRCIAVEHGQRISPTGAVEIEGPIGEVLGLEAGAWTLTAIVGARSSIEGAEDPCAADGEAGVAVATREISIKAR